MAQKKNAAGTHDEIVESTDALPEKHLTQKKVEEDKSMSKRRAVIVGINDYQGTWNDLPSCVRDAESFRDYLNHKLGFSEIKLLTDKQATRGNVAAGLDWLFEGAGAQDRLVFFYSGHGTTRPDGNVMQEYLCLYDDILQDDEISRRTQELPDGVFTAIIDCCFSGGVEKRRYEAVVQGFNETSFSAKQNVPHLSVERSQVKTFLSDPQQLRVQEEAEEKATFFKPFAQTTRVTAGGFRKSVPVASSETSDLAIRGTMIAAALETETAASCTSQTNGLSAFTFALLTVFENHGPALPLSELVQLTTMELRMLGLRQTPRLKTRPVQLVEDTFLNMDHIASPNSASERLVDRRSVENLVRSAINSLFLASNQQIWNPETNTTHRRENMYSNLDKSNINNITASVLPFVLENVQREQARRAQFPGMIATTLGSQFGGTQFAGNYGVSAARPLQFCALEAAQRISSQVLQALPVEYRQFVSQALVNALPMIVEAVSREIGRINPYINHYSHNLAQVQQIEWMIYNVIVTIVESVVREHQLRLAQQTGLALGVAPVAAQFGQLGQLGQYNQFAQLGQPGQYNLSAQLGQIGQLNQFGQFGQYGQAAQYGVQNEQYVLWQTISAIVPVIVEIVERERARLSQLGQYLQQDSVAPLAQQILLTVQQMPIPATVLGMLPGIIELICRQLVMQAPLASKIVGQNLSQMPAFNTPAMV